MNIGIDIDGVLTNIAEFALEKGLEFCKETGKGKLMKMSSYDTKEAFGWDKETDDAFWEKYLFLYAEENPVIDKASENIKKLKEDGHKLYIITARGLAGPDVKNIEIRDKMRNTVKNWLDKNDIVYDDLIFTTEDKSQAIRDKKIDIMIDDSPYNLRDLSKITKMICYDWPYNRDVNNDNICRCYNWDEIYEHIKNIK